MTIRGTVTNLGFALAYALVFLWCYVSFLNYNYEYAGYDLYSRDIGFLGASLTIAVLPVVLHRGLRGISTVIAVLIYLMLYVPIILTFALASAKPISEIVLVQFVFMGAMCLLFLTDVILVKNP